MNFSVEKDLGRSIGNPRALSLAHSNKHIPIPDKLWQDAKGTRYTEQHGVKVHFFQTIVVEKDTRVCVDIGIWVLDLAECVENIRGQSVYLRY
jgi:hypothetical protein